MEHRSVGDEPAGVAVGDVPPDRFPVVGLGASAGGIEAFATFLAHTPPDSGMAFVVILHLAPEH